MEEDILEKESIIEKNLIDILWGLDVDASVKTNKKSLPYKEIFETILNRTKPYSEFFNFKETYKEITKEILNKGCKKIRFYCELIQMDAQTNTWNVKNKIFIIQDKPNYKCFIKYYIHY